MEENIKYLYEDILISTKSIDGIIDTLSKLDGPTLCVGCGGSKVVAEFTKLVLTKKNKIIAKALEPRDVIYENSNLYQNIIGISYSGTNYGIKHIMKYPLNKLLLTTRKTSINSEKVLTYQLKNRHSFISLTQTIVPMAIMLKYYLGDKFDSVVEKIFLSIDKSITLKNPNIINIFTGLDTMTPTIFLESTFIESGIGIPIIHFKYDYCHGRSTINKKFMYSSIYLENNERDIDITLKKVMELKACEKVIIKGICEDEVINNFYITLQLLYMMINIAKDQGIDLANIKYDKEAVKELYYFKGSM